MAQDSATVLKSMAVGRAECHLLRLSASAWDGLSRARLLRTVGDRRLETPSHGNLGHSTARNDVRELKSLALGRAHLGVLKPCFSFVARSQASERLSDKHGLPEGKAQAWLAHSKARHAVMSLALGTAHPTRICVRTCGTGH